MHAGDRNRRFGSQYCASSAEAIESIGGLPPALLKFFRDLSIEAVELRTWPSGRGRKAEAVGRTSLWGLVVEKVRAKKDGDCRAAD
jgi:hypothetical protein